MVAMKRACTSRRQRGRDAVGIDGVVVEPFGLQENLVAVACRRSAPPCPRSRGNSAGRARRWRRNRRRVRCALSRDDGVAFRRRLGDVAGRPAGSAIRAVIEGERRRRVSSPGCGSSLAQSIVRPSSRAGVPVFSRPRCEADAIQAFRRGRTEGAFADPAGGDARRADMDDAAQKGAGGDDDGAWREVGGRRRDHALRRGPRSKTSSDASASTIVRFGCASSSACIACAVERAVGLGARAAHRRALAAVQHAELDAGRGRRRGPSGRRARRSRERGAPCRARRWPGCRTCRRSWRGSG